MQWCTPFASLLSPVTDVTQPCSSYFLAKHYSNYITLRGHAVAQLVEALRYKPEVRGFDSRWCHWNFSLT